MNYHVLTLFPEMIEQGVGTSITGRAIKKNIIGLQTVNIRDFSTDKHRRVDDYTYGGGAGMLMQAQPVFDAYTAVRRQIDPGRRVRTIYVTPQGHTFTQHMAEEFAMADDLIFLCGHYEGIDERVLEEIVTDYVSIGDYVLTGGELAAMVMIDAISRMVPGVLHNDVSADTESFHGNLLEYPQYTRPEEWHGKRVPAELLSGDPKTALAWRMAHAISRTKERRPDLYEKYCEAAACRDLLMTQKISNMDMISQIDQGHYRILSTGTGVFLMNPLTGNAYFSDFVKTDEAKPENEAIPVNRQIAFGGAVYARGDGTKALIAGLREAGISYTEQMLTLYVLTRREKLPVAGLYRPDGKATSSGLVIEGEREGICRIRGLAAGRAGLSPEGAVEYVVTEENQALTDAEKALAAKALLTWAINRLLEQGKVPYLYLAEESLLCGLVQELGLYPGKRKIHKLCLAMSKDLW